MGIFSYPKLEIKKPIRLIELFAGIGAQAKALENLNVPFEHYRICEFDKYAVTSYNAVHNTNFEPSDITKITADDLGIVDTEHYCYLMTYSFPCQDLSNAGKQRGMTKGGGTRSGLLWEVERLLNECEELPQILLMENVPQVIGQKNIDDFELWLKFLRSKGYTNKYQLLNAKDYGVPQNRNRCFMVSWLGNYDYDFPKSFPLELRLKDMLEEKVDEKYYLSEQIINFFNRNSKEQEAKGNGFRFSPSDGNIVAHAITTHAGSRMDDNFIKQVGQIYPNSGNPQAGRIYDADGLSPAMDTCSGGNRMPKIIESVIEESKNIEEPVIYDDSYHSREVRQYTGCTPTITSNNCIKLKVGEPVIAASRGRNPENPSDRTAGAPTKQRLEIGGPISNTLTSVQKDNYVVEPNVLRMVRTDEGKVLRKQYEAHEVEHGYNEYRKAETRTDGVSNALTSVQKDNLLFEPIIYDDYNSRIKVDQSCIGTITTNIGNDAMRNGSKIIEHNYRIRKLTPKECWRLMGFSDGDFERAKKVNSNSQLYKQAGNSIVVDVLMNIFKKML